MKKQKTSTNKKTCFGHFLFFVGIVFFPPGKNGPGKKRRAAKFRAGCTFFCRKLIVREPFREQKRFITKKDAQRNSGPDAPIFVEN